MQCNLLNSKHIIILISTLIFCLFRKLNFYLLGYTNWPLGQGVFAYVDELARQ